MKYHRTAMGDKIPIKYLETEHLRNIIAWIERKAIEGFTVRMGGGFTSDDIWMDEETYIGEDAKKHLNYYDYTAELDRRNKTQKQ